MESLPANFLKYGCSQNPHAPHQGNSVFQDYGIPRKSLQMEALFQSYMEREPRVNHYFIQGNHNIVGVEKERCCLGKGKIFESDTSLEDITIDGDGNQVGNNNGYYLTGSPHHTELPVNGSWENTTSLKHLQIFGNRNEVANGNKVGQFV